VVDAADLIRAFILSLEHLLHLFPPTATSVGWKMTPKHLAAYYDDPEIKIFELRTASPRWWE
jgi:hypothetical protein